MRHIVLAIMLAGGPFVVGASLAFGDGAGDPTPVKNEMGKYYDKEGNPTFKVQSDGTVDWFTYSGFRRYHSDCHVCHGPDGEGSSYAPAQQLLEEGELFRLRQRRRKRAKERQHGAGKRHAIVRHHRNVMCYIEDIFVYLRARANDAVPRGRPQKHEDKPEAATQAENSCLGLKN